MARRIPGGRLLTGALAALLAGIVLWIGTSSILGVAEPWDSSTYWVAYLLALVLSALFGYFVGRGAWLCGVLIVFAQLPVMLLNSEPGPLAGAGFLILLVLSAPAALVATVAARFSSA